MLIAIGCESPPDVAVTVILDGPFGVGVGPGPGPPDPPDEQLIKLATVIASSTSDRCVSQRGNGRVLCRYPTNIVIIARSAVTISRGR
jgi:hypothetical protein